MAAPNELPEATGALEIASNGPVLWLNWAAQAAGRPARQRSRPVEGGAYQPLWEEHTLYSDTYFTQQGDGVIGPYQLLLNFGGPEDPGMAAPALVLRSNDYLADPPAEYRRHGGGNEVDPDEDISAYAGGRHGEQMASLLSLALHRRLRSGGVTRIDLHGDPVGQPMRPHRRPPSLLPPLRSPIMPGLDAPALLNQATPLLAAYAGLASRDAVAVQRAAHQFADALWWSEADPRVAWIKLFGAVEAAAEVWDHNAHPDPVAQLTVRHPGMVGKLSRRSPEAIPIVAQSLSRVIGAERKMIDFILAHLPLPPDERPAIGRLDYSKLEEHLRTLYDHRSRELHGGIPFPPALCEAPYRGDDHRYSEVFLGLAVSGDGGYWPASRLPMLLHTFAHIAGSALRSWWRALPQEHR